MERSRAPARTREGGRETGGALPASGARLERLGEGPSAGAALRVSPGQVWNDEGVRGTGGPLLVLSVDSAYAYCRRGREGDGEPRRIPLAWFNERRRGGLRLIYTTDGPEDLVERRALTAVWELDYTGRPATTETVCVLLGGFYSPERVEAALEDAQAEGLALKAGIAEGEWKLTGGGRRIAAVVA
jgi:hypothetical protein